MVELMPITRIPRSGVPGRALVCGDPARAERIAGLLDGADKIAADREYVTFRGYWKGTELLVSSHGVGGPGAICAFEELVTAGVTTIIRVGTCGALRDDIQDGSLVVATGAVRDDGATHLMVPPEYPAMSSPDVVLALEQAARTMGHPWFRGVVWTKSLFYPGPLDIPWEHYLRANVLAVEMELSALLVLASIRGVRAGGILTTDGNPLLRQAHEYNPRRDVVTEGVRRSSLVALAALHALE